MTSSDIEDADDDQLFYTKVFLDKDLNVSDIYLTVTWAASHKIKRSLIGATRCAHPSFGMAPTFQNLTLLTS